MDGESEGTSEGLKVGVGDGFDVGETEGLDDGNDDGLELGTREIDGVVEGILDGSSVTLQKSPQHAFTSAPLEALIELTVISQSFPLSLKFEMT